MVLGGGLEPPRLTAYAPQTYVSAISPPELVQGREMFNTTYHGRKDDYSLGASFRSFLVGEAPERPCDRTRAAGRLWSADTNTPESPPSRDPTPCHRSARL